MLSLILRIDSGSSPLGRAYDVEYTLEELILDALKQEYELKGEMFPY